MALARHRVSISADPIKGRFSCYPAEAAHPVSSSPRRSVGIGAGLAALLMASTSKIPIYRFVRMGARSFF